MLSWLWVYVLMGGCVSHCVCQGVCVCVCVCVCVSPLVNPCWQLACLLMCVSVCVCVCVCVCECVCVCVRERFRIILKPVLKMFLVGPSSPFTLLKGPVSYNLKRFKNQLLISLRQAGKSFYHRKHRVTSLTCMYILIRTYISCMQLCMIVCVCVCVCVCMYVCYMYVFSSKCLLLQCK